MSKLALPVKSPITFSHLLFDLDGTLSDPLPGFANSINYALTCEGFEAVDLAELATHVGPPLEGSLQALTGTDEPDVIAALVAKYRERYSRSGYTQNRVYPGIKTLLHSLTKSGYRLAVCTSKREDIARMVLDNFNLAHHFEFISGGDIGVAKGQQLEALLQQGIIDKNALMIGDRVFDIVAAKSNLLKSAAVTWGYGSQVEIIESAPDFVIGSPAELLELANRHRPRVTPA